MYLMDVISSITFLGGLCFILGFLFVLVEMFHPGFGFPGVLGGILLFAGVGLTAKTFAELLGMLIIIVVILCIALTMVLKSATKGKLSRILVLHEAQKKETGYVGSNDLQNFLGSEGITTTILRPAGSADFGGIMLDVVTEGGFINRDVIIKIIEVRGRRIVVREIKQIN